MDVIENSRQKPSANGDIENDYQVCKISIVNQLGETVLDTLIDYNYKATDCGVFSSDKKLANEEFIDMKIEFDKENQGAENNQEQQTNNHPSAE